MDSKSLIERCFDFFSVLNPPHPNESFKSRGSNDTTGGTIVCPVASSLSHHYIVITPILQHHYIITTPKCGVSILRIEASEGGGLPVTPQNGIIPIKTYPKRGATLLETPILAQPNVRSPPPPLILAPRGAGLKCQVAFSIPDTLPHPPAP